MHYDYLTYKGETLTVTQWAHKTHQKPDTLFKRKSSGWTDADIITGNKLKTSDINCKNSPWPFDNKDKWEKAYQNRLYKQFMTPIEFYIQVCSQHLSKLYNFVEEVRFDPYFDHSKMSPAQKWDLESYSLWSKRIELASTYENAQKMHKKAKANFSKQGLSFTLKPLLGSPTLSDIQGALQQDRPPE